MVKRIIAILMASVVLFTGCAQSTPQSSAENNTSAKEETVEESTGISDEELEEALKDVHVSDLSTVDTTNWKDQEVLDRIEDKIYEDLVAQLDSEEFLVEKVEAVYVSDEYIEEMAYNSKSNVYFGYTEDEMNMLFQDSKYVFTLGDDGSTTYKPFEDYDDTYERVLKNVAIGTGVIVVCVVISVVTYGAGATAIGMTFAYAAQGAAITGITSGAISAIAAGVVTGITTKDMDQAVKAAALAGSESYKWGCITGAIMGGASEAIALHGATLNGLTMNEAAIIQKETRWPLQFIKNIHSMDEASIYQSAGLSNVNIEDYMVLAREIDWNFVDDAGRTNVQRVLDGMAPCDSSGIPYEIHHVGQQNADTVYALLTKSEHMSDGHNKILHYLETSDVDHGPEWDALKKVIWKGILKAQKGIVK